MSAEKRIQNWILVAAVLLLAVSVPLYKMSQGEPALKQGIDLVGGVDLLLQAEVPEGEERITTDMILGAINIVRNRLDPEGVREILIQQLGEDRIVVQIPGEDDPEQVKRMIGATATLRFIDAGSDPIPQGTHIRYIDAETGEPIEETSFVPEGELETAPSQAQLLEDLPPSVVTAEQIIMKPEDLVGFTVVPSPEPAAEGEEPSEVALLQVNPSPAGVVLARHTTQHRDEYLALVINNRVAAVHPITESITNSQITWPGLADEPGFSYVALNENLQAIQVVAMPEAPEIGTTIELFDMFGGGGEGEAPAEMEEGPAWVDVTTDKIILTGDDFADADVTFGQLGQPIISFQFKASGREIFGQHTARNVQKYLAIALDNEIISCPIIREPILQGRGIIEGSFSLQQAEELVVKLDSGRLPVPLNIIENRTVGPTLGKKSISDSRSAAILGAILILLFMAMYYRLPGVMADLALIFYVAVFFGALSVLNATLTLPGIAGFILSVGMAVDANVIIFERLKEELKTGKTFRSATESAFKRAFLAIFDANVTTLITAIVLYNLGTGPIRGFAVTLSLGILVSMFSALVFTRLLIEGMLGYKNLQKYSLFGVREADVVVPGKGGDE